MVYLRREKYFRLNNGISKPLHAFVFFPFSKEIYMPQKALDIQNVHANLWKIPENL